MLVTQLTAHVLIKAKVPKKHIIIVLVIIYGFFLLWFTNMFHRIFHTWWITVFNLLFMGGIMYGEMLYLVKFINSEKGNGQSK